MRSSEQWVSVRKNPTALSRHIYLMTNAILSPYIRHRICNNVTHYVQMNAKQTKWHDRATAMQTGFVISGFICNKMKFSKNSKKVKYMVSQQFTDNIKIYISICNIGICNLVFQVFNLPLHQFFLYFLLFIGSCWTRWGIFLTLRLHI